MATLGEIGSYLNGRGFKKSEWRESGRPIIRIQNLTGSGGEFNYYAGEAEERHIVRDGDLLVSWAATLGVFLWHGPEAVLNQHIFKVDSRIDPAFHRWLLEYTLASLQDRTHGSGMVHITKGNFDSTPVQLPPLAEQGRIVAAIEEHLSRLDAAETALTRAEHRVRVLDRVRVRQAFEAGGWPWTTLGEIAEIKGGVTKDSKRQSDASFVEVPYLRVANVQRGRLDLSDVTTIHVHPDKAEALRLEPGDVLLNEGGDRDKLGRGWVWEGQVSDCIHQNHVFRARLNDAFDPYFVSTHANTWGRAWFEAHGKQTTNLASINLGTLKQLPIPAPPRSEQQAIMGALQEAGDVKTRVLEVIDHARLRARVLRRSILAAAFSGQLVPQDPTDEPASVLLDRIRAERAAAEPTKRTRRAARSQARPAGV